MFRVGVRVRGVVHAKRRGEGEGRFSSEFLAFYFCVLIICIYMCKNLELHICVVKCYKF